MGLARFSGPEFLKFLVVVGAMGVQKPEIIMIQARTRSGVQTGLSVCGGRDAPLILQLVKNALLLSLNL